MKSANQQETNQQATQEKPTMLDLWHRHPESQTTAMIEEPGIAYVQVVYAFCGYPVTQQEFDAVLAAFNRLTGCHYTQEEIAGVWIMRDAMMGMDDYSR
jgi:hypothetical protein